MAAVKKMAPTANRKSPSVNKSAGSAAPKNRKEAAAHHKTAVKSDRLAPKEKDAASLSGAARDSATRSSAASGKPPEQIGPVGEALRAASTPNNRFLGLKNMLIAKRDSILKEAKQEIAKYVSGENRQLVDTAIDEADWAAVDISEDISLKRLGAHRQLLLDIEECIRKINEGTYGICEDCGEEISEKRLNVIPTATLCIDCKEIRERMAAFEHESEV